MGDASVDFESYYSTKEKIGLKTMGVWEYLHHPRVEIHTVSIACPAGEYVGRPEDAPWDAVADHCWWSHNAAFDSECWYRLCELHPGLAQFTPAVWNCTANMSTYLGAPRDLAGAVAWLLGRDISKDVRKQMDGRTHQQMVASGFIQEVHEYALRDAHECLALATGFQHLWPEVEQRISLLTIAQCARGLPLDLEYTDQAIATLERVMWEAQDGLPWRSDGEDEATVLSTLALAAACRSRGIAPPTSTAEDSAACAAWEAANPGIDWIQLMRAWRKANLLREKLRTMRRFVRDDGRMHYGVKYFGAHTGRWSGDQKMNAHGLLKFPMEGTHRDGTPYSIDQRRCITAPPGKKFIIADEAQVEPRVEHWLVGDTAFLDQVRAGMSVYEVHARTAHGWTGGVLKREDPKRYSVMKSEVLGLGYGMGHARYREYARTDHGVILSALEARAAVNAYRRKKPLIVGYWEYLDELLQAACRERRDLAIELPSWRSMVYRDVRRERIGEKQRVQVVAGVQGRAKKAFWGSLLCENVVQATSRDVFALAMLHAEDAGLMSILSVHDEMLLEVDEDADVRQVLEIMRRPPEWAPDLPLDSEPEETRHYKK